MGPIIMYHHIRRIVMYHISKYNLVAIHWSTFWCGNCRYNRL